MTLPAAEPGSPAITAVCVYVGGAHTSVDANGVPGAAGKRDVQLLPKMLYTHTSLKKYSIVPAQQHSTAHITTDHVASHHIISSSITSTPDLSHNTAPNSRHHTHSTQCWSAGY